MNISRRKIATIRISIHTKFTCQQWFNILLTSYSTDERRNLNEFQFFGINRFSYEFSYNNEKISLPDFCTRISKHLYLSPNLYGEIQASCTGTEYEICLY